MCNFLHSEAHGEQHGSVYIDLTSKRIHITPDASGLLWEPIRNIAKNPP